MKLLDRYVLVLFIKNYLIWLTVIIGLYVVMDMMLRFDDILKVEKQVGGNGLASIARTLMDVGSYYFYHCFGFFVQMSGIIPVLAAGFTLMRLSRYNELTAFLAAGIPMLRISLPIIVAATILNALVIIDQELILPGMIPQLLRSHEEMHKSNGNQYPITAMQVDQHSVLICGLYDPDKAFMRDMDLVERNSDLMPIAHLRADTATWNAQGRRWDLKNGRYVADLLPGQRTGAEEPATQYTGGVNVGSMKNQGSDVLTPDEIELYHGSEAVEFLSTRKINQLIARPKSYGTAGLNRIKNLRLTQPFMNVVLLLLAIPAVLTFDPKTLKTAATKCLLLIGFAMGSVFLCQQIAGKPPLGAFWMTLWPALMSWMPIFIFAPLAVFLLDRVKS